MKQKNAYIMSGALLLFTMAGCGATSTTTATNEPANQNNNAVTVNTNSTDVVDTNDWQTYTNEEYGFSFRYPADWRMNQYDANYLTVSTENITDLPTEEKPAPTSSASPITQSQNRTEQLNLLALKESSYGGKLIRASYANFYQYNAVVENKAFVIEYVTYTNDLKITLRYLEDNSDQKESSDNLDNILLNIVQTFKN